MKAFPCLFRRGIRVLALIVILYGKVFSALVADEPSLSGSTSVNFTGLHLHEGFILPKPDRDLIFGLSGTLGLSVSDPERIASVFLDLNYQGNLAATKNAISGNLVPPTIDQLVDQAYMTLNLGDMLYVSAGKRRQKIGPALLLGVADHIHERMMDNNAVSVSPMGSVDLRFYPISQLSVEGSLIVNDIQKLDKLNVMGAILWEPDYVPLKIHSYVYGFEFSSFGLALTLGVQIGELQLYSEGYLGSLATVRRLDVNQLGFYRKASGETRQISMGFNIIDTWLTLGLEYRYCDAVPLLSSDGATTWFMDMENLSEAPRAQALANVYQGLRLFPHSFFFHIASGSGLGVPFSLWSNCVTSLVVPDVEGITVSSQISGGVNWSISQDIVLSLMAKGSFGGNHGEFSRLTDSNFSLGLGVSVYF